jgi:serine/threonine protein kinase
MLSASPEEHHGDPLSSQFSPSVSPTARHHPASVMSMHNNGATGSDVSSIAGTLCGGDTPDDEAVAGVPRSVARLRSQCCTSQSPHGMDGSAYDDEDDGDDTVTRGDDDDDDDQGTVEDSAPDDVLAELLRDAHTGPTAVEHVSLACSAVEAQAVVAAVTVAAGLRHPNMAILRGAFVSGGDRARAHVTVAIRTDRVVGASAATVDADGCCAPIPLSTLARYAKQAAAALYVLHAAGVSHGAVHPRAIRIVPDTAAAAAAAAAGSQAVLCDFGRNTRVTDNAPGVAANAADALDTAASHSSVVSPAAARVFDGSMQLPVGEQSVRRGGVAAAGATWPRNMTAFVAPEIMVGAAPSPAGDMWGLGVTLYALVYGTLPFPGNTADAVRSAVLGCDVRFPPAAAATRKWERIIAGLLAKDPVRRTTAAEVLATRALKAEDDDYGVGAVCNESSDDDDDGGDRQGRGSPGCRAQGWCTNSSGAMSIPLSASPLAVCLFTAPGNAVDDDVNGDRFGALSVSSNDSEFM